MPVPSSAMVTVKRVSPPGWSVSVPTEMRTPVAPPRREFCNVSVSTSASVDA